MRMQMKHRAGKEHPFQLFKEKEIGQVIKYKPATGSLILSGGFLCQDVSQH